MSKYSGKCDFGDSWVIGRDRFGDHLEKLKVFVGNNIVPLRIDSYRDALPYFPFLTGMVASSEDGTVIYLSSASYVDEEEEEILKGEFNWLLKEYKNKKRKLERVAVEDILPSFSYYSNSYKQLAERIVESNGKCELPKDIHTEMAEYYRKELYEDMLKEGWDDDTAYKWCYGFDRWMEKIRKDRETNS